MPRFIGTLDSTVVGRRYHPCAVAQGQVLRLRREPDNPHDANAIAVDTLGGQQAGYLPRTVACWFAEWLDGGAIETTVLVPFHAPEDARYGTPALVVVTAPGNVRLFGFPRDWRPAPVAGFGR